MCRGRTPVVLFYLESNEVQYRSGEKKMAHYERATPDAAPVTPATCAATLLSYSLFSPAHLSVCKTAGLMQ